jgi:hypothetical protein
MLGRALLEALLPRLAPASRAALLHSSALLHAAAAEPAHDEDVSRPIEAALPKRKTARAVFDARTTPVLKRARVPPEQHSKELARRWKALTEGERERFKEAASAYNHRLKRIREEVQLTRIGPEPPRAAKAYKEQVVAKLRAESPDIDIKEANKLAKEAYSQVPLKEKKVLNAKHRWAPGWRGGWLCVVGWLAGSLAGWFAGWWAGWLAGWLAVQVPVCWCWLQ